MKSIYIRDLKKGMVINGETFAVQQSETAETKDKKPYYKLTIADKTGLVKAFVWSENIPNVERGSLKEGNVILIDGTVEEFRGVLQVNILKINKVDENTIEEFVEGSEFDLDELWKMLERHMQEIKNAKLALFVKKIFEDGDLKRRFKTSPAAEYIHHSFRGGLLEHVVEMLDLIKTLRNYYTEADFDLIIVGIILHDIGKIFELESVGVITRRTKEGYLIGHMIKSYELLLEKGQEILNEEQILNLKHIILSHHGSLEFGSPVVPATIEAAIVHTIDYASSKIRSYQRVIRKSHDTEGRGFSEWDRTLGTKVYRGTILKDDAELL
ncbi:MAG TPA: HD domain-containing protein [Candidatus Dojkabacteria bacterium]|nr:HD domain-containing protein [Candidatus Dojkabacteria bacterium]